jgi:hypothetical protein
MPQDEYFLQEGRLVAYITLNPVKPNVSAMVSQIPLQSFWTVGASGALMGRLDFNL